MSVEQSWRLPARNDALAIAVLGALTIAGAWIFQAWGYQPCDLCLEQRTAYYVGIPLAVVAALCRRAPAAFRRDHRLGGAHFGKKIGKILRKILVNTVKTGPRFAVRGRFAVLH